MVHLESTVIHIATKYVSSFYKLTNVCFGLPLQPVDATHALKRSAGVS